MSSFGSWSRLGRRWQTLHRLTYVAAVAGAVHFWWLALRAWYGAEAQARLSFALCSCVPLLDPFKLGALFPVNPVIAPRSEPAGSPLVLIVEDDLGTRVMYRDYLVDSGFQIVDAHNGHQALAKARERPPDAIVTDLAVPGMDGFEFCRALKQSAGMQDIPILAVTGHAEYLQQPDRFEQAGIAQVLIKPCPPDVLVRELRRLLERSPSSSSIGPR